MKIIICDDDSNIIKQITNFLDAVTKQRNLFFDITSYTCGDDVKHNNEKFDIAFVDIEMPGIGGLSVTKYLQEKNPNIIIFIVTSFQSYLDDAMALQVFRFLSKPLDKNRFIKNINMAIDIYQKSTQNIAVKTYDEFYNIFTRDIIYITIEKRKACVVTIDRKLQTLNNFDFWKKLLKEYDYFAQSHYSYIVNLKNVTNFSKTEVTLSARGKKFEHIPISRRYYSSFKDSFQKYIGVTV
ncbi:MAG: response regulator transcription factor [Ruminococcus sp.]|nr:response regulator transcription factor [Ruminococcus sp.]